MNNVLYPVSNNFRIKESLDGLWDFKLDWKNEGKSWINGLPEAISMPVPSSFNDYFTTKDEREFAGDYYYQKVLSIPTLYIDKCIELRFGAVVHKATVYLNGVEVGSHVGGFLPFTIDITNSVKWGDDNLLVVKANNELTEVNLPAGRTITLANGKKMNKPYFDFFNYAGLIRPVTMIVKNKEFITDYNLVHSIEGDSSRTKYEVFTNTAFNYDVEVKLYDEENKVVSTSSGKSGELVVQNVKLWNVLNAYLYKIEINLLKDGALIDSYAEKVGIRTVEIKGEQILVNNKGVYLKGFGKHEECDITGRGYNLAVAKRDFELMKWVGANSFRTAHYPYSEEIYQLADQEGILVIDEVPAVGFMESLMNFMDASSGKVTNWFDKATTPQLLENHLAAIEELIARDKNHACVIAWSLLNEPETTTDSARPYFETVFARALEVDPQQRPRTFALIMSSTPGVCKCYDLSDFIMLNRYFGWYFKGGYELSDGMFVFKKEMDAWKALNLNKPFVFSEYGADTLSSEHSLPSRMWSQEYQCEYIEETNKIFDSYSFIKGEQVWNFADFMTGEGIMRVGGNKKGIFTRNRQPKDIAYAFKKRWEALPLDYKC